jgi:hypothetical protein
MIKKKRFLVLDEHGYPGFGDDQWRLCLNCHRTKVGRSESLL